MSKIITYTAITGGKDEQRQDIKCFGEYDKFKNPILNAKIYKVLPFLFFEADYSIWVDGNIKLKKTPEELVSLLGDKDIAVLPNPYRNCLYEEGHYCILHNIGDEEEINEQLERYRQSGYKELNGLYACGVIIRKHTPELKQLCFNWWAEITRGSARDQISFPFVFDKEKIRVLPFQANFKNNVFFERWGHIKTNR
jgi:hypothetical protein